MAQKVRENSDDVRTTHPCRRRNFTHQSKAARAENEIETIPRDQRACLPRCLRIHGIPSHG